MKTNTIHKLATLAILGVSLVLAAGTATAGVFRTYVLVGSYPAVAPAGATVQVPVQLGYQELGSGRWVFLSGRTLTVNGYLNGGTMRNVPYPMGPVTTGANGRATITFQMPHKLRNAGGYEVGTAFRVTVKFAGEPPSLLPGGENRTISIGIQ